MIYIKIKYVLRENSIIYSTQQFGENIIFDHKYYHMFISLMINYCSIPPLFKPHQGGENRFHITASIIVYLANKAKR